MCCVAVFQVTVDMLCDPDYISHGDVLCCSVPGDRRHAVWPWLHQSQWCVVFQVTVDMLCDPDYISHGDVLCCMFQVTVDMLRDPDYISHGDVLCCSVPGDHRHAVWPWLHQSWWCVVLQCSRWPSTCCVTLTTSVTVMCCVAVFQVTIDMLCDPDYISHGDVLCCSVPGDHRHAAWPWLQQSRWCVVLQCSRWPSTCCVTPTTSITVMCCVPGDRRHVVWPWLHQSRWCVVLQCSRWPSTCCVTLTTTVTVMCCVAVFQVTIDMLCDPDYISHGDVLCCSVPGDHRMLRDPDYISHGDVLCCSVPGDRRHAVWPWLHQSWWCVVLQCSRWP